MSKVFLILILAAAATSCRQARTEYVWADVLNCRAQPTTDSAVVAKVRKGQQVRVIETQEQWSHLEAPSCWVASRYLSNSFIAAPASGRNAAQSSDTSSAGGSAEPARFLGGSRSTRSDTGESTRSYFGSKQCKKGQPCGNSCISWNKTCRQ